MTRVNLKLKVSGILLAALILALVSVVQISAAPLTSPAGYLAYRTELAARSAIPDMTPRLELSQMSAASAAPMAAEFASERAAGSSAWQAHLAAEYGIQPAMTSGRAAGSSAWQAHLAAEYGIQPPMASGRAAGSSAWQAHLAAEYGVQPAVAAQPAYGSPEWIAAHPGQAIDGNTATSP
jgi:hypothetical protein